LKKVIRAKDNSVFDCYFNGLTVVVPASVDATNEPHCHSVVGQQLLLVDWKRAFGMDVPCPDSTCNGMLANDRTNCSKNKTLFPVFGLSGAPSWCMVMRMTCLCCKRQFNSNDSAVLLSMPQCMSNFYPVEPKCALTNHSFHLERNATEAIDSLMLTHANGELCSRLLHNATNRSFVERIASCCSCHRANHKPGMTVKDHIEKDGTYVRQHPPLGDTIRDMCDESNGSNNRWGISEHNRHAREIQSVKCTGVFAQDHTFEVCKNCQKGLGAKAAWDVATSTGEIATAACAPSTKTIHFSHAVRSLSRREGFKPKVMCSDTWPNEEGFWKRIFGSDFEGRLGLFHFERRMLSTLRKKHADFLDAVTDLLSALCEFESTDYENLLIALKNGTLSSTNK